MNTKSGSEEAFVDIKWPEQDALDHSSGKQEGKPDTTKFYDQWVDNASAKYSNPLLYGADMLRRLYPKHSLVLTTARVDILSFPDVSATPLPDIPLITDLLFIPLARSIGSLHGVLVDQVQLGAFKLDWKTSSFILYTAQWPVGLSRVSIFFILHEGPEDPARALLLSAGVWSQQLHDEIWVFNQGFWSKDHGLWVEVQKADWKDVILKDDFKKALQKDVYGFFTAEEIYKELAIPWKRGLILYGPPGNGKTISLKAIMKTCGANGFAPLYVKSFQSYKGEEGAMADVFDKARQVSPCVIVLEDLDSLINDKNRSFFLNQLDGLDGNNGLLIIGTTNHFDRLDPGLSTRPSRFDRKFKFDDPGLGERAMYAKYWQRKLENNKDVDFPDSLVNAVAEMTDHFSFAYLKEAFVSCLVILAGYVGNHKPTFESALKAQIKTLRNQLDKPNVPTKLNFMPFAGNMQESIAGWNQPPWNARKLMGADSEIRASSTNSPTTYPDNHSPNDGPHGSDSSDNTLSRLLSYTSNSNLSNRRIYTGSMNPTASTVVRFAASEQTAFRGEGLPYHVPGQERDLA